MFSIILLHKGKIFYPPASMCICACACEHTHTHTHEMLEGSSPRCQPWIFGSVLGDRDLGLEDFRLSCLLVWSKLVPPSDGWNGHGLLPCFAYQLQNPELWWASVHCRDRPSAAARRQSLATSGTAQLVGCISELGKKMHFSFQFPSLSQFTMERRSRMGGARVLCFPTRPLPSTLSGGEAGGFSWWFAGNIGHMLKSGLFTLSLFKSKLQPQNGGFTEAAIIVQIKIFIQKPGRDTGTWANVHHYHNHRHKPLYPSIL